MTAFNLPPGVRSSDIPGNRPQDIARERARERVMDDVEAEVRTLDLPEWMIEAALDVIWDSTERFDDYVESKMDDGFDEPPCMEEWDR